MNSAAVVAQLTELNDEGDGEPEGGDAEGGGEDPLGGPAGGLEAHKDVSCVCQGSLMIEKNIFLSQHKSSLAVVNFRTRK